MKNTTAQIATRVEPEIRDAIQRLAVSQHRTISQQTALILSDYVHTLQAQFEKKGTLEPIASDVRLS